MRGHKFTYLLTYLLTEPVVRYNQLTMADDDWMNTDVVWQQQRLRCRDHSDKTVGWLVVWGFNGTFSTKRLYCHLNLQGIAYWSMVVRHIFLTSCNTISPQGLYAHPLLISYSFRDITYHLDLVLSASQPHGFGTNSLSTFAKPSHFLLLNAILRLAFSSQLTPPPSDPPSNAP